MGGNHVVEEIYYISFPIKVPFISLTITFQFIYYHFNRVN